MDLYFFSKSLARFKAILFPLLVFGIIWMFSCQKPGFPLPPTAANSRYRFFALSADGTDPEPDRCQRIVQNEIWRGVDQYGTGRGGGRSSTV